MILKKHSKPKKVRFIYHILLQKRTKSPMKNLWASYNWLIVANSDQMSKLLFTLHIFCSKNLAKKIIEDSIKKERYEEAIKYSIILLEKQPDYFRIKNLKTFWYIKLDKPQSELEALLNEMMNDFDKFKDHAKSLGSFAKSW